MPLYHRFEDVRVRLLGKVQFTEDDAEAENKMHIALAKRLMNEAEGNVEFDLSPRYAAPLQTVDGESFSKLPLRPTQEVLRTLCELKSVIRILETDFGRGTAVEGDKYTHSLSRRYKAIVSRLVEHRDDTIVHFKYPPLLGLRLATFNTEADDGFQGRVMNTSDGFGDFATSQINSPQENWWNIEPQDLDVF